VRALLTPVLAVCLLLLSPPAGATDVHATDVHGDNAGDRYVGTGGLVLPGSVDRPTRTRVATCGDCRWRLAGPCADEVFLGHPFPGQPTCLSVVRGCPGMAELLRVWFQQGADPWTDLGLVCIGPGGPVTVQQLEKGASAEFAHDLPRLRPATAPPAGALAQLPVAFDSRQPSLIDVTYQVLGQAVRLHAAASWEWAFGDGGLMSTQSPGGPYPDMSVAHTYRSAGRFPVQVTTRWAAEFEVGGLGPFPVREPVEQSTTWPVIVGEGRAVLAVR
jgi:hypothetical protein